MIFKITCKAMKHSSSSYGETDQVTIVGLTNEPTAINSLLLKCCSDDLCTKLSKKNTWFESDK